METRTYQVYKFSELSKEVQERAIDKWYDREDYQWLKDDIMQELYELDTLKLFSDVRLQYSLSYRQGDGLSFSANIDFEAFLKNKGLTTDKIDLLSNAVYKFVSTGNKGLYCYAHKDQIQYEENERHVDAIWEEIDRYKEEIANYYIDICNKLKSYGYSVIEYRMSKEDFEELCEDNGYMFTKDGKLE